jgi:hypothetical protein
MAEEFAKDFIKFVVGAVIVLMIFTVVFGDQGVVSNTINFMTYVEPILLQDYISSALTVASYAPGDYTSNVKTSGYQLTIKIYKEDGTAYVSVVPSQENPIKTKFAKIEPTPILVDCSLLHQTIELKESQTLTVEKKNNECRVIA